MHVVCCPADVANLVLDGADGIVLGSETFRGKFPVQSVDTVLAICRQAEKCFDSFSYYNSVMDYAGYHSLNPDISKVKTERAASATATVLNVLYMLGGCLGGLWLVQACGGGWCTACVPAIKL
jgi:pyruvate kinase